MKFQGSKARYASEIIPILTQNLSKGQWYVEPFCGGCNLIDKVMSKHKIASDNNKYLIALLKHVQQGGSLPNHISYDEYYKVKNNKDQYTDWYVGHILFCCSSFNIVGVGYGKNSFHHKSNELGYNITQERAKKKLLSQNLKDITLVHADYTALDIPTNSIVYCDPPYANTTGYKDNFDSDAFWQWARGKCTEGHQVFISEYNAPEDFVCLWSKRHQAFGYIARSVKPTRYEKLFIHDSQVSALRYKPRTKKSN